MLVVRLLLGIWMSAILALQIFLYPPRPVVFVIKELNLLEPYIVLKNQIASYLRTIDPNEEFMRSY